MISSVTFAHIQGTSVWYEVELDWCAHGILPPKNVKEIYMYTWRQVIMTSVIIQTLLISLET